MSRLTRGPIKAPVFKKRPSTVILDMDETLLCTFDGEPKIDTADNFAVRESERVVFTGRVRPYAYPFIEFCANYFDYVVIISAGERNYVRALILGHLYMCGGAPNILWTDDDLEHDANGNSMKSIKRLRDAFPQVDFGDVLAIDNTPGMFLPGEAIVIPDFKPKSNEKSTDEALFNITLWLLRHPNNSWLSADKTNAYRGE